MAIKFTQVVDFTTNRLVNVGTPTGASDGVNKSYVDAIAAGIDWKEAVRAASTANIVLATPGAAVDGVTLAPGDRFLAKDQTAPEENGIYVFNGAAALATRAGDADTAAKLSPGTAASVAEGSVNADHTFILITDNPIVLGTTALAFTLMNGGTATVYTAANGLLLTGSAFSAVADTGILVSGTGIAVDPVVVERKFASDVGDGTSTTITVTHNLGTKDCHVTVYSNATPWDDVYCGVARPDANNVTLDFGTAPAAAAYRVHVSG